ncbi:hypothetical protein Clacol_008535 [Clathrus columnatus]|uniref:Alpha-type protein kinase domain-containing protein n=1 Tax=Clathrus columnatus TaxID=1419009 RepID=A0AAV5APH1_9AGAM|nr:hypothetical protein Clacol_008535 [Clathrus columnatus]
MSEILPPRGKEVKGKLKLLVKEGELYNFRHLQWWKASRLVLICSFDIFSFILQAQVLDTSVASAYIQGFAFSPYGQPWPREYILPEMSCFYEVGKTYNNLVHLAKTKGVVIAKIEFGYKLLRIKREAMEPNIVEEYLWSPVSNYSKISYADLDVELDNYLINETFSALSHYSYEESQNNCIHTGWAYMKTNIDEATVIAITTHDQCEHETQDEEGCPVIVFYPHNIRPTGVEFWRKSHTCFTTCEALGLTRLT